MLPFSLFGGQRLPDALGAEFWLGTAAATPFSGCFLPLFLFFLRFLHSMHCGKHHPRLTAAIPVRGDHSFGRASRN